MIRIDHHSPMRSKLRAIGHGMSATLVCFIRPMWPSNYHNASYWRGIVLRRWPQAERAQELFFAATGRIGDDGRDARPPWSLRQRVGSSLGDLRILRGQRARDADRADNLAVDQDRNPALQRCDVLDREQPQSGAARGDGVVERLARALERQRGARLTLGGGDGR